MTPERTDSGGLRPLAVSLAEAARLVSLSKFTLRRRIKDGRLKATRVGNRWIVPVIELQRFVSDGTSDRERQTSGGE